MNIFDLRTSTTELESSNQGVAKNTYEQVAPTRDCTGTNFPNGAIHFKFNCIGNKWFIPGRSYLRFRITLTDNADAQLESKSDIAPCMNHVCGLFQSAEFRINDKTVSRSADYMAQIDTLQTRLNKSKAWIDSVGNSTNYWNEDFTVRQIDVCSDIGKSKTVNSIKTSLELGYTNACTVAISASTNELTFSQSVANQWKIGDIILLGTIKYNVSCN